MKKFVFVLALLVAGCGPETVDKEEGAKHRGMIPQGAKFIEGKGEHWFIFELDGQRYLMHASRSGHGGFSALTPIPSTHKCPECGTEFKGMSK